MSWQCVVIFLYLRLAVLRAMDVHSDLTNLLNIFQERTTQLHQTQKHIEQLASEYTEELIPLLNNEENYDELKNNEINDIIRLMKSYNSKDSEEREDSEDSEDSEVIEENEEREDSEESQYIMEDLRSTQKELRVKRERILHLKVKSNANLHFVHREQTKFNKQSCLLHENTVSMLRAMLLISFEHKKNALAAQETHMSSEHKKVVEVQQAVGNTPHYII